MSNTAQFDPELLARLETAHPQRYDENGKPVLVFVEAISCKLMREFLPTVFPEIEVAYS